MNVRSLRCLLTPPFHHDWKLADALGDQKRESGFVLGGDWADPTQREFREYRMRCARCGEETWWSHTDAPARGPLRAYRGLGPPPNRPPRR